MIKKIVIDNFMAHERTELELGPGVTALTGPNNSGKSAIVEALRCVATNAKPKHFIRHGAKEARVSIEMDDGARVTWIRKKLSAGYEITLPGKTEPEEGLWKLQGKVPDEVKRLLRLDLVELETGGEIDVHVGNQREPVFLLNRPDSNAAAFFAASTESAHLLAMQNLLKNRTQDAKRSEREFTERLTAIHGEMDQLAPLPEIAMQVEAAKELEVVAQKLRSETPVLEKCIADQKRLAASLKVREGASTVLGTVSEPPELSNVSALDGLVRRMNAVRCAKAKADRSIRTLTPLASPPEIFDTVRLGSMLRQLKQVQGALRTAGERGKASASLKEPPSVKDVKHLAQQIDHLIAMRYRRDRLARWEGVLRTLVEPPVIQPDARLAGVLADIRGLTERTAAASASLSKVEERLQSVRDAIAGHVQELGCCPTCGADLNVDALLDHGCRHEL